DDLGEVSDALTVEGGLHRASLASPELAVAGDEALSQRKLKLLIAEGLPSIVGVVVLEDVLDVVGVPQQEQVSRAKTKPNDVAVLGGCIQQKAQTIPAHLSDVGQAKETSEVGRSSA